MRSPFVIVGLGNPGAEYENTRHNIGFHVVDSLCRGLGSRFRSGTGEYLYSWSHVKDEEVALVKPLSYMNNSGDAVAFVLQDFGASVDHLLIVLDDLWLPLGKLRMRPKGSDGGHNGLASVIRHLQTEAVARLRCGIGPAEPLQSVDMAGFVLSPFDKAELQNVKAIVERGGEAVIAFVTSGIEQAMSRFNE